MSSSTCTSCCSRIRTPDRSAEIVGVGLDLQRPRGSRHDLGLDAVAGGIGQSFVTAREAGEELAPGVGAASPAPQLTGPAAVGGRGFRHPALRKTAGGTDAKPVYT